MMLIIRVPNFLFKGGAEQHLELRWWFGHASHAKWYPHSDWFFLEISSSAICCLIIHGCSSMGLPNGNLGDADSRGAEGHCRRELPKGRMT
ncbi:unnamed protein product [Prunus armeniaca]